MTSEGSLELKRFWSGAFAMAGGPDGTLDALVKKLVVDDEAVADIQIDALIEVCRPHGMSRAECKRRLEEDVGVPKHCDGCYGFRGALFRKPAANGLILHQGDLVREIRLPAGVCSATLCVSLEHPDDAPDAPHTELWTKRADESGVIRLAPHEHIPLLAMPGWYVFAKPQVDVTVTYVLLAPEARAQLLKVNLGAYENL